MSTRQIAFGVGGIEHKDIQVRVIGRCFEGPILLGDTFTVAFKRTLERLPDGYGPGVRSDERAIALKVDTIWAYNHSLDELPPGMTGRLTLSGLGSDVLREDDVLSNSKPA